MLTEKEINRINGILENKTFTYTKGFFDYDLPNEVNFDYKFKILGYRKMISVGEYYDYIKVSVKLLNFRDDLSKILISRWSKIRDFTKYFREHMYYFRHRLNEEISTILSMFDNDVRVTIDNIEIENSNGEEFLQEQKIHRNPIRTVVKDIVNIIKSGTEGYFYLPDNDEGQSYNFEKIPFEFNVEIDIIHDINMLGFKINSDYSLSDDTIEFLIIYNPKSLSKNLYDIIGELNEILTHEIVHGFQNYRGELFDLQKDEYLEPIEYYLQSHEIPAQVSGFKRLSKLRKLPFDVVVKDWFKTHKDIHRLSNNDEKIIISKILNYKK
jgi:hypothetical protein